MVSPPMVYRRFEPPALLRDLVEHTWVTRHDAPTRELALPDGRGLLLLVGGPSAVVVDPLEGTPRTEATSLRGPALRVRVRDLPAGSVRLGVQLAPLAPARLGARSVPRAGTPVDELRPVSTVLPDDVVARAAASLSAGDDAAAVAVVHEALAHAARTDSDEADRLTEVLDEAAAERGLVRAAELARRAGVPLPVLHRWCVHLLGVEPSAWLSAVRFAAFVRETVGTVPLRPTDVMAALRWYAAAGYSARETERFTGLSPAELRRLVDRLTALVV